MAELPSLQSGPWLSQPPGLPLYARSCHPGIFILESCSLICFYSINISFTQLIRMAELPSLQSGPWLSQPPGLPLYARPCHPGGFQSASQQSAVCSLQSWKLAGCENMIFFRNASFSPTDKLPTANCLLPILPPPIAYCLLPLA